MQNYSICPLKIISMWSLEDHTIAIDHTKCGLYSSGCLDLGAHHAALVLRVDSSGNLYTRTIPSSHIICCFGFFPATLGLFLTLAPPRWA